MSYVPDATTDPAANAKRGYEVEPLSEKYSKSLNVDQAALSSSTTIPYPVQMDGKKSGNFRVKGTTTGDAVITVTIEGSMEPDEEPGAAEYDDITQLFGVSSFVVSGETTDSELFIDDNDELKAFTHVRVLVDLAVTAGTGAWVIYSKEVY
jgi:hypothetical protein